MKRPVRTTLVYALLSAIAVMPAAGLFAGPLGWPLGFKLALWLDLCGYALLLARWNGKGPGTIGFPLAVLLGAVVWPGVYAGFLFLGLGVLSWIRSGICFGTPPLRAACAEIVLVAGGAGLVALLSPGSTIAWAIGIWLFFLVQSLYFFVVPAAGPQASAPVREDTFEQAYRDARRVLDEGMAG